MIEGDAPQGPRVVLSGLATVLPANWVAQADAAAAAAALHPQVRDERLVRALYQRSGVARRYSVLLAPSEEGQPPAQDFYRPVVTVDDRGPTTAERMARYAEAAPPLAADAGRRALASTGLDAASITHLVSVSCTGFVSPGFDLSLIDALELRGDVARTHVGFMGCHAALNGLRVARAFAASDPGARVLLVAVELCSLHHQYSQDPEQIVANALFADGAAACVVQQAVPAADDARPAACEVVAHGACLLPATDDMMSWRIGDHGFRMTLSPKAPDLLRGVLRGWMDEWLRPHGETIDTIAGWGIHPGGPRILSAAAEGLGLSEGQLAPSRSVLRECGNMSSPTVLFVLERLQQAGVAGPCVLLAFGPGLTIEGTLVRLVPGSGNDCGSCQIG